MDLSSASADTGQGPLLTNFALACELVVASLSQRHVGLSLDIWEGLWYHDGACRPSYLILDVQGVGRSQRMLLPPVLVAMPSRKGDI